MHNGAPGFAGLQVLECGQQGIDSVLYDPPFPSHFNCCKLAGLNHFSDLLAAGFEQHRRLLDSEHYHSQGPLWLSLKEGLSQEFFPS